MRDMKLNISAHQTAQLLIERLRDETVDERTAIEAAIQQLRLLVERPNLVKKIGGPIMKLVRDGDIA